MKASSPILEFLNKNYKQIYKYVVNRENNMKWEKTILDGEICHHLKIMRDIHIEIKPHDDEYIIYIIWPSQDGCHCDSFRISNIEVARQIAEGVAKAIKKYGNKVFK